MSRKTGALELWRPEVKQQTETFWMGVEES